MSRLDGLPILTAEQVRAAEAAAIEAGHSAAALMQQAGAGVATWSARLASGAPIHILCGPGNNGGDGYVAARLLRDGGVNVAVAALGEPRTEAAGAAAAAWSGPVAPFDAAATAPVVVDALFGTGASRPLDAPALRQAGRLFDAARFRIAVDLPSGLDADAIRGPERVLPVDLTLALGALKPAHLLQPAAAPCGEVRCIPLPIAAPSMVRVLSRPALPLPGPDAHKYTRGLVAVVGGAMPGAATLAATAALRAGAGYGLLLTDDTGGGPAAIVRRPVADGIDDKRIGALVAGPGLGRDHAATDLLAKALGAGYPLILDGDAVHLLSAVDVPPGSILTPHAGEFRALFGDVPGNKIDRTRAAATTARSVVVHKGVDTVIAAPDGRVAIMPPASPWLSTAGTGDVLCGAIAAMRAAGLEPFAASCAGVWLHARAAAMLGPSFIADDLAEALTRARA